MKNTLNWLWQEAQSKAMKNANSDMIVAHYSDTIKPLQVNNILIEWFISLAVQGI